MDVRRRQDNNDIDGQFLQSEIDSDKNNDGKQNKSDIRGDTFNITLLFFLYLLQGIPLGLTSAIPMLLQNRGASYKEQAEFSFAFWPFSLKLLWAPIVDSLYSTRFGKRKSWLVPTQYLIGIFMLILSSHIDTWLGNEQEEPNVQIITTIFFGLNFLAATQDIAVDAWALTMLKPCNVGHSSTCNSVGQTAGYFLGYVVFIALESKDFCNTYIYSEPYETGLLTLPSFLWFWGICFLVTTTIVAFIKKEVDPSISTTIDNTELTIKQTYSLLFHIIKLRPVQVLIVILLTVKVTFSASDAVTSLKLIDAGVPREKLALLLVPLIPLQIILPLVISKYTAGAKPMDIYIKAIPYRIYFSVISVAIVYITPFIIHNHNGEIPTYYYVLLIGSYACYQIFLYCMFVAVMAFFAKISDPHVGGTYMTLLNTLCNLGGNWPNTIVLWLVDYLTWGECINNDEQGKTKFSSCSTKAEKDSCISSGGLCNISIDGYYVESLFCLIYGIFWLKFGRHSIRKLQNLPIESWRVVQHVKIAKHRR